MRILFFGTSAFAVPSLERLVASGREVVRCVTQPDRPQGRGLKPQPSPVKHAAARLGVPVEEPERLEPWLPHARELQPDLGVVIAYGRLIPKGLLTLPRHAILGVHPSLLPKYRGASPVVWAMLQGERTTGVTIFRLNERLDAGEILLQRQVEVEPRETAVQLSERLAAIGAETLVEAVARLEQGTARFEPQDDRVATAAPKLAKTDGRIDWAAPAASIDRLVRAAAPWPGAYTAWRGRSVKVVEAEAETSRPHDAGPNAARPGQVLSVEKDGLVVAAGDGRVVIRRVQLAGRRPMGVREFTAGHHVEVGERLG